MKNKIILKKSLKVQTKIKNQSGNELLPYIWILDIITKFYRFAENIVDSERESSFLLIEKTKQK